ncbi:MAG: hypothetical protein AAGJ86_09080 [Pseudomonadota bacterium]
MQNMEWNKRLPSKATHRYARPTINAWRLVQVSDVRGGIKSNAHCVFSRDVLCRLERQFPSGQSTTACSAAFEQGDNKLALLGAYLLRRVRDLSRRHPDMAPAIIVRYRAAIADSVLFVRRVFSNSDDADLLAHFAERLDGRLQALQHEVARYAVADTAVLRIDQREKRSSCFRIATHRHEVIHVRLVNIGAFATESMVFFQRLVAQQTRRGDKPCQLPFRITVSGSVDGAELTAMHDVFLAAAQLAGAFIDVEKRADKAHRQAFEHLLSRFLQATSDGFERGDGMRVERLFLSDHFKLRLLAEMIRIWQPTESLPLAS